MLCDERGRATVSVGGSFALGEKKTATSSDRRHPGLRSGLFGLQFIFLASDL